MDTPSDFDPLTATSIPLSLLRDYANKRNRGRRGIYSPIRSTLHPTLPLAIQNYTHKAMRAGIWDPLTCAARSLVTDTRTGAVISRSFSKFFNFDEVKHAYKPTGGEYAAVVEEKVDGSIASLFWFEEAREWILASKGSFTGTHVKFAREILESCYPNVTEGLDKEKTYVFEIIHPNNIIMVKYHTRKDLVLLSIIGKDGSEPPPDFDWSTYPFSRPGNKMALIGNVTVDFKSLRALDLFNQEGFIVKYWRTRTDRHPQRVKIKFDSYLLKTQTLNNVSPQSMLDFYICRRKRLHSFDKELVREEMNEAKKDYLDRIQLMADDFGGEKWVAEWREVWGRVEEFMYAQEIELINLISELGNEGFEPGNAKAEVKQALAMRLEKLKVPGQLSKVLFKWIQGAGTETQIMTFLTGMSLPKSIKNCVLPKRE